MLQIFNLWKSHVYLQLDISVNIILLVVAQPLCILWLSLDDQVLQVGN